VERRETAAERNRHNTTPMGMRREEKDQCSWVILKITLNQQRADVRRSNLNQPQKSLSWSETGLSALRGSPAPAKEKNVTSRELSRRPKRIYID